MPLIMMMVIMEIDDSNVSCFLAGNSLVLGVNCDGISMIKEDDKFIMYEYAYGQIESVTVDATEKLLTITLSRSLPPDTHKCFVFETAMVNEIGALIASYCPQLGGSSMNSSKLTIRRVSNDKGRACFATTMS